MVILHSVSQYLSGQEFDRIAALFHGLLRPGGLLLVGDVVPPTASAIADALALLRFGWRDGFFIAAVAGLVRTFFSDYTCGCAPVGRINSVSRAGDGRKSWRRRDFVVSRAPVNLGHLSTRMTFLARRKGPETMRPVA